MDFVLNITDASSFLNYSPASVRRFVKQGKLKAYRHSPRSNMRFKEEDLKAFLNGKALKKSPK